MVAITHQEVRKTFPSATSTGARRFVGKTAIVVGASANVGNALAELLAQEGADVLIHYNSASKSGQAEETTAVVRGHGPPWSRPSHLPMRDMQVARHLWSISARHLPGNSGDGASQSIALRPDRLIRRSSIRPSQTRTSRGCDRCRLTEALGTSSTSRDWHCSWSHPRRVG